MVGIVPGAIGAIQAGVSEQREAARREGSKRIAAEMEAAERISGTARRSVATVQSISCLTRKAARAR